MNNILYGNRYQTTQLLYEGPTSKTYKGVDLNQNTPVVIKTVPKDAIPVKTIQEMESRLFSVKRIKNDSYIPIVDIGTLENILYIVRPHVEGTPFDQILKNGPLKIPDAIERMEGIIHILHNIHQIDIVHRNLNPQCIFINEKSNKVHLSDFWFLTPIRNDGPVSDQTISRVRYMSPEQAGLINNDIRPSSDIYSLGIILYETLTGAPPYQGKSISEILNQHLSATPPDLNQLDENIPSALNSIVQRCLRKDPNDRYQTVRAVELDLKSMTDTKRFFVPGRWDRRQTLADSPLICRDTELEDLTHWVMNEPIPTGSIALVESESGQGKSKLVNTLHQRIESQGAMVLSAQGQTQVARRPFQELSSIANKIIQEAAKDEEFAKSIYEQTKGYHDALSAALPELSPLLKVTTQSELGPEQFGEARTLRAMCTLLGSVGRSNRPTVIILDDIQWTDDLIIKLLIDWQKYNREEKQIKNRILFVAAFRSEEVSDQHPIRKINASLRIRLKPFNQEQVKAMAESMAGPLPASAISAIFKSSNGVPFMVSAVLRGLVESHALIATAEGWEIDPTTLSDIQSSQHAAAFLTKRITLLPDESRKLLSIGAVMGKRFDLNTATLVANLPLMRSLEIIKEAQNRQLVWIQENNSNCLFVHDKIREAFLDQLSANDQKEFHRLLAHHLTQLNQERSFELAYHFDAAGESGHAFEYALEAAKRARRQYALEAAEQQYRICERGVDKANPDLKFEIFKELGQVLMLRGIYDEAILNFEQAEKFTADNVKLSEIHGKLGEVAFKCGDMTTSIQYLEKALRLLGVYIPNSSFSFFIRLAFNTIIQVFHTYFPKLFLKYNSEEEKKRELLEIRLLGRLAYSYWFKFGPVQCLWAHIRAMNLVEHYPPTLEMGQVYSEHSPGISLISQFYRPLLPRGDRYLQKSFEIRKSFNDIWGQGQTLCFYSLVLYCGGRYEEGVEKGKKAISLLEKTGDYWEVNIARYQTAASLLRLGRFKEAIEEAMIMQKSGLEIGDIMASGISLDILARAAQGHISADVVQIELDRPRDDVQPQVQVMLAEGVRLIGAKKYYQASQIFKQGIKRLANARFLNQYVAPVFQWTVTALRLDFEHRKLTYAKMRDKHLNTLKKMARLSLFMSNFSYNDKPHAYRESALVAAMVGDEKQSRLYFRKSLWWASKLRTKYEKEQTRLAMGQIGSELDWPNSERKIQYAKAQIEEIEKQVHISGAQFSDEHGIKDVTLSLVDRFDNIVEQGRLIARALSKDLVFETLQNAVMTLIRGEECHVFEIESKDGRHQFHHRGGNIKLEDSMQGIIEEIIKTEESFILNRSQIEEIMKDENLGNIRSAIGSPIFSRGRPVGFFILIHRNIAGLFSHEEKRLADYLSTIAGAAMENTEGFVQLQNLNSTLESRVEERTKELRLANAKLEQLTFTDPLTKLMNRRGLENVLSHECQINKRKTLDILVLLIDLDDFKHINDNLGYSSGDIALKQTAQQIRETLRDNDYGARIGGDEFIAIFKDTRIAEGMQIAERLCSKITKTVISGPSGSFKISASLGLVRSTEPNPTLDDLLAQTHIALHRSKLDGKGRVTIGGQKDSNAPSPQQSKFDALESLRAGKSLYCVKMPIMDCKKGSRLGHEFLIRSSIPGFEMPDDIFGLCRESDVLATVDYECFKACVKEILTNPIQERSFINIFPYTIVHLPAEKFREPFGNSFQKEKVVIEISEQQIIGDPSLLSEASRLLKEQGFLIAMDDVGFGRSNLETFIALEPNIVKIDKRFVQGIAHDKNLQVFMKRTLNIINNSETEVVAEGIENQEDLDVLLSMGIRYGQGYIWGKPQRDFQDPPSKAA